MSAHLSQRLLKQPVMFLLNHLLLSRRIQERMFRAVFVVFLLFCYAQMSLACLAVNTTHLDCSATVPMQRSKLSFSFGFKFPETSDSRRRRAVWYKLCFSGREHYLHGRSQPSWPCATNRWGPLERGREMDALPPDPSVPTQACVDICPSPQTGDQQPYSMSIKYAWKSA